MVRGRSICAYHDPDPHAGLPEPAPIVADPGRMKLYETISRIETEWKSLRLLRREVAFAADARLQTPKARLSIRTSFARFANSCRLRGDIGLELRS